MAQVHDTMMNPPIEDLLSQVDSKFTLVTLGRAGPPDQLLLRPARRGPRRHRAAAGHLGGPQAAVDRLRGDRGRQDQSCHRPIEVEPASTADEARAWPSPRAATMPARRPHRRPRRHRRHRRLQGRRGLPPPGRRRRPRGAGHDRGRHPLRRRGHLLGPGLRAGADLALWTSATRSRTPGSARRADLVRGVPGHRPPDRRLRRRHLRRPAHRHPAGHPGAGRRVPGHAHRDVGAPGRAGEPGHAAPPGRHVVEPADGPAGRRRHRRRPPGRPRRHRGRRRPRPGRRPHADLDGLRVLVTAGGTREPIDPVRVITNRSSGKQGYALAERGRWPGAPRSPWSPPSTGRCPPGVEVVEVASAAEMEAAVVPRSADADVVVMAAAVADFRPAGAGRPARSRRATAAPDRCSSRPPTSSPTWAGASRPGQMLVGFAAETDDVRGQRPREARPQGPRPRSWPTTCPRPARASSTTPTGRDHRRRRDRA